MNRKRTPNDALTKVQVKALLEGITIPRDKLMIQMGIYSGCRVNELRWVRYDKLDFVQNTITVFDDKKNQWTWKIDTQTGRKVRDKKLTEGRWRKINLPGWLMVELQAYIKTHPTKTEFVWNISWGQFERVIQKWTSKVLHIKRSWHTLRHTYVSLHARIKTPMSVLRAQTGDTAATLQKVYEQADPDTIREAAEANLLG
jgi:integrase